MMGVISRTDFIQRQSTFTGETEKNSGSYETQQRDCLCHPKGAKKFGL